MGDFCSLALPDRFFSFIFGREKRVWCTAYTTFVLRPTESGDVVDWCWAKNEGLEVACGGVCIFDIMSCSICASILATGKGKKHHKKLNGGYFDSGRTVLFKCIERSGGISPDQIGLNSSDATVCYECCRKLDNIAKLESET